MQLSEIIIKRIQQHGGISFRDFMEMALYYPELGYYTSKREIGKKGDYYTSPNVSAVFGEMIGRQIEEMWYMLGEKEFTVVEIGAGTGLLSKDVLQYLRKNDELYSCLDYCIVEKSHTMRREQRKQLTQVRWCDIKELSGITGCIFSNELVDAFPVHVVVVDDKLMEVFVDYKDGFVEVLKPASKQLKDYFNELGITLPRGFRTEINLEAIKYINEVGKALRKGFIITIDYGYHSEELYQEYRCSGTLMCYYKHTANDNPYQHIGEQDITSHVNFSALIHWGRKAGLELCGFVNQMHFLLGLGIEEYIKSEKNPMKILQIKTLLIEMGEIYKVLIQSKGIEGKKLSGLSFVI